MYLEKKTIKQDSLYTTISSCRICRAKNLKTFLEFGNMPLAGGFIKKEDLSKEKTFPLTVVFCETCKETQILETISSTNP